ncbi:MAG TPA: glycoside hydrolase family 3 C-terminal domain-containing protein, partial [Paludibacter sp.]|nr:glycoside hydrolase family 3 C-terminal domain-containing protein [Paludibacter sp.]
ADHHAIVLNAAKKSITLLKNNGILPLKLNSGDEVVVTGPRSAWPNKDNDPNTIWQSIYYDDNQAKTYTQAISERGATAGIKVYQDSCANPKVAVVVIGEKGYTHGTEWADKNPNIPADQLAIIQKFHNKGVKVVTVILTPRPYVLTPLVDISDAILLVYRGGTGIGQATASLIFGDYQPSGRLPFQLPKSDTQLGTDNLNNIVERWELPYDIGATEAERIQIRNYIKQGLTVPPVFGDPLYQYGFGMQAFNNESSKVTDINKNAELHVYPNPFKNSLIVDLNDEKSVHQFLIEDITGKILINKVENGKRHEFNLSQFKSGVYILIVRGKTGTNAIKLIKN